MLKSMHGNGLVISMVVARPLSHLIGPLLRLIVALFPFGILREKSFVLDEIEKIP